MKQNEMVPVNLLVVCDGFISVSKTWVNIENHISQDLFECVKFYVILF